MEKQKSNTANRELHITRLMEAPIELVWEVCTNPDHIKNWWGPNGFTNTIHKMDVRPGGEWNFIMHEPDGTDYENKKVYKEVVTHKRIVFEHVSFPRHTTTITFTDEAGKTLVDWYMLFESIEEFEQAVKTFKADQGLAQNMEKLAAYFINEPDKINRTGATPVVIERTYDAAIDTVWAAITDRDKMSQWYFDLKAFRPEVGFEFQFLSGPEDRLYTHICKVTEVVPVRKIAYSWRFEGYTGMSHVSFELFDEGGKTRLKLTHEGLETFPASNKDFAKSNYERGWTYFIDKALNEYLDGNSPGARNKDKKAE